MGWLRFSEDGRKFDCINCPNTAHPVPVHVEEVKDVMSVAQYILVVEKESVFQRLTNDRFCKRNRCIVVTGRGYPDVPTRRFLRLLVEHLHLPVYCLVDCDPYGFDILAMYRFGSMGDIAEVGDIGVHHSTAFSKSSSLLDSEAHPYDVPKNLCPYDRRAESIFCAIENGCIPGDLFDDIPCKYINGAIICQILNAIHLPTKAQTILCN